MSTSLLERSATRRVARPVRPLNAQAIGALRATDDPRDLGRLALLSQPGPARDLAGLGLMLAPAATRSARRRTVLL